MVKVDTKLNKSDFLTKALGKIDHWQQMRMAHLMTYREFKRA